MKRFTFTVGLGKDRDGLEISQERVAAAVQQMRAQLIDKFGGFTESPGVGGYRHDSGAPVLEPSVRWIVIADDDGEMEVGAMARWAGKMLNQESVMVEVEEVQAKFVQVDDVFDTFSRMSERTPQRVLN